MNENDDMERELRSLTEAQRKFQTMVGIPINSEEYPDKVALSEIYIFKAIEELVELRKTIPSTMNKWAKNQPSFNRTRILEELCDVELFLMNFKLVWGIGPQEMINSLRAVQHNNFEILSKKLSKTTQEVK